MAGRVCMCTHAHSHVWLHDKHTHTAKAWLVPQNRAAWRRAAHVACLLAWCAAWAWRRRSRARMLGRVEACVPAIAIASVCGCALSQAGCRRLVVGAEGNVCSMAHHPVRGVRVRRVTLNQ